MITHKTVKELGLTIEQASNSLIVPAVGISTRPLEIIKDLPVKIDHITIPLTVEVVDTTSYSLLLENDWNQKVEATITGKMAVILLSGKTGNILSLLLMKVTNLYLANPLLLHQMN